MIAIFRKEIHAAGGIESWLFYLARLYSKTHNITIYYQAIAPNQLLKLSKLVRCVKYTGQEIECDKAIFCFDFIGIETTTAKEYIHVVHADYVQINLRPDIPEKVTKIYAVSKLAAKSFKEIIGKKCEVLYNPVDVSGASKPLKLISATRLSEEKGLERMRLLAKALDAKGVNYDWDIYTPNPQEPFSDNVVFRKPKNDILSNIKAADFLVQLSDTESYCYSVVEALCLRVPVVVTDLPVFRELHIQDGVHGVVVPLAKKNYMDVADKLQQEFNFGYTPPKSDYSILLGKGGESDYEPEIFAVKNVQEYPIYFTEEGVNLQPRETITIFSKKRLDEVLASGLLEEVK